MKCELSFLLVTFVSASKGPGQAVSVSSNSCFEFVKQKMRERMGNAGFNEKDTSIEDAKRVASLVR